MSKYSRGGCATCRRIHVKCDEKRPGCSRCVNRGLLCPGYQRPLRWSQRHEQGPTSIPPIAASPTLNLDKAATQGAGSFISTHTSAISFFSGCGLTGSGDLTHKSSIPVEEHEETSISSTSPRRDVVPRVTYGFSQSVFQDSAIFIDSYSGVLARVLSIYDGLFNPFRAAALSTWRRSPLLFSTFKFFVGVYHLGFAPNSKLRLEVDEAQLGVLGQLSSNLARLSHPVPFKESEALLVINMFGLSSSWYDLGDLGLEHYTAAATLVRNGHTKGLGSYRFYEEFLVYWWMMLSFASGSDTYDIPEPPTLSPRPLIGLLMPHPLTGVSPESQLLLGKVGQLVLTQRRLVLEQGISTTDISLANVVEVCRLELQLLSLQLPALGMVLDPLDPHTPIQDLLIIAEAYRMCGLILLYHAYPDLLVDSGLAKSFDKPAEPAFRTHAQSKSYLASLALDVLRLLDQISPTSGTRTIEAILLVIVSGELSHTSHVKVETATYSSSLASTWNDQHAIEPQTVLQARGFIMARFEQIQGILPFQTIRRMRSLVIETWRLMDSGSQIFWVDLLIQNEWQFLMI